MDFMEFIRQRKMKHTVVFVPFSQFNLKEEEEDII